MFTTATLIIIGTIYYVGTRRKNREELAEVIERPQGKNSLNIETKTHGNYLHKIKTELRVSDQESSLCKGV